MGLLDAFQLGEALRLPFLHADLFLGELRGAACEPSGSRSRRRVLRHAHEPDDLGGPPKDGGL